MYLTLYQYNKPAIKNMSSWVFGMSLYAFVVLGRLSTLHTHHKTL